MRKGMMMVLALIGLLGAGLAFAQESVDHKKHEHGKSHAVKGMDMKAAQGKTVTVIGEVLDMDCYMNEGASGKEHQSCAVMCLKNGGPVGLLTDDGKAYFLTGNEEKGKMKHYDSVREMGGQKVKITGVIQTRGGSMCLRIDSAEKV